MGARNRVGIGLSYRPARLHRADGINPLESIPGLHKRLKIRALWGTYPILFVGAVMEDVSPEAQFIVILWALKPSTS
jgi:hypothetical protein